MSKVCKKESLDKLAHRPDSPVLYTLWTKKNFGCEPTKEILGWRNSCYAPICNRFCPNL